MERSRRHLGSPGLEMMDEGNSLAQDSRFGVVSLVQQKPILFMKKRLHGWFMLGSFFHNPFSDVRWFCDFSEVSL